MRLPPFLIEELFAQHEFTCEFNLTGSDVEGVSMRELLALADDESRRLWDDLTLGYAESGGHPLLRAEIANTYDSVCPEEVQVFAGGTEAAFALVNVVLGRGDHAVVIGPVYQLLADLPQAGGASATQVDLRVQDGWALDLDRVRAAVQPNTRLIVCNFPHNPTGALLDRATFAGLVDLAAQADALLLCDEIYRGLEHAPATTLPAGVDLGPHVISLSGMSKVYGLAGTRVGWIATHDRQLSDGLLNYRYWTTLCTSAPAELLALTALRAAPRLLERSRGIVAENLRHAERFMQRHEDLLAWVPPAGGTTAFPWLRSGSADELSRWLVDEHGVLVAPASVFATPGEHFRFGLGRTAFSEGLQRMEGALAARSPQGRA